MSYVLSYLEILEQIDAIDPVQYAKTRNHLSGAVTRLSPYISRGIITLPQVRDRLLQKHSAKDCEKLIQELAWREYFQQVWFEKGEAIFADLRFPRDDWKHNDLVSVMVDASTGIIAIDEAIKELYTTGYMHNHARMWVAALATNLAQAHWHTMGKWLYYHLIDGDLASNFLSWQWVAGTSVNKRYTANQELINVCSTVKQSQSWLSVAREEVFTMTPPEQFSIAEPFAYVMEYPEVPDVLSVYGAVVQLYTPWTLDPQWRTADTDEFRPRQILVIDPVWFDRYPVSSAVLDFIMRQGKTVMPVLEVFVGDPRDINGITDAEVYLKNHQTNQSWPGYRDPSELMFPAVTGYYQSFFAYWQSVQKQYLHV
jgi:deoxyribodipyrimidine photo-lyase